MTEIDRISRKTRRHVYVSKELDGAADELLPDYVTFSEWAESAMWSALIGEFGEADVLDAVDSTQADMDDDELLPADDRDTYELPA